MPPPELRNLKRPAAEFITTESRAGKIGDRPQGRSRRMLKDSPELSNMFNGEQRKLFLVVVAVLIARLSWEQVSPYLF